MVKVVVDHFSEIHKRVLLAETSYHVRLHPIEVNEILIVSVTFVPEIPMQEPDANLITPKRSLSWCSIRKQATTRVYQSLNVSKWRAHGRKLIGDVPPIGKHQRMIEGNGQIQFAFV